VPLQPNKRDLAWKSQRATTVDDSECSSLEPDNLSFESISEKLFKSENEEHEIEGKYSSNVLYSHENLLRGLQNIRTLIKERHQSNAR